MELELTSNHTLEGGKKNIGIDHENYTEELTIFIKDESLRNYQPFLEFETDDGNRYSTDVLELDENGYFSYLLPNGILKEGQLDVQVVLRDTENNIVWKSQVRAFLVTRSVNADEQLQEEYPDFISQAIELMEQLEQYSYEFSKLETIEYGAQVNVIEKISKNGTLLPIDQNKKVNIDLSEYALGNEAGANFTAEIDNQTYIMTFTLLDRNNNILAQRQIDLPIESVVVSGSYDNNTKSLVLTLQSGQTITIPVGGLISGLQTEITSNNKLDSDLVDDTNNVHKFVTQNQKDKLDGIEANAQVNVIEGIKINGVDLPIDQNKKSNIVLSDYFGAVPVASIEALFEESQEQEQQGGNE